jgi:hypothetical protein
MNRGWLPRGLDRKSIHARQAQRQTCDPNAAGYKKNTRVTKGVGVGCARSFLLTRSQREPLDEQGGGTQPSSLAHFFEKRFCLSRNVYNLFQDRQS